jgi:hypothetical protein
MAREPMAMATVLNWEAPAKTCLIQLLTVQPTITKRGATMEMETPVTSQSPEAVAPVMDQDYLRGYISKPGPHFFCGDLFLIVS